MPLSVALRDELATWEEEDDTWHFDSGDDMAEASDVAMLGLMVTLVWLEVGWNSAMGYHANKQKVGSKYFCHAGCKIFFFLGRQEIRRGGLGHHGSGPHPDDGGRRDGHQEG